MKAELNRYIKYVLIILLLYLSYLILKPYLTVIVISLILALMTYPLHGFLLKYVKNRTVLAGALTIGLVGVIVVPLLVMANFIVLEAIQFYYNTNVEEIYILISEQLQITISPTVQEYIQVFTQEVAGYILRELSNFAWSIPQRVLSFFIMLMVFFYIFKDGDKLLEQIRVALPLEDGYKKRVEQRVMDALYSLFYGQIAVSFLVAVVASVGYYLFGVDNPFIWGLVTGLFAFLPGVGPGLVYGPMAFVLFLRGEPFIAIGLVLFGALVLSTLLDTVFRAKVMGYKGNIHPITIVLGVLGGISVFGFIGSIIGPLILVLLDLAFDMYVESKEE